jgi:hypothetical protein
MATKKKATKKKTVTRSNTGTIARDSHDHPETVGEMMKGKQEEDREDAITTQTSARVKQCHLLVQEMDLLLRAARKETATHGTIRFELARVQDLTKLAYKEAKSGLEVLDR